MVVTRLKISTLETSGQMQFTDAPAYPVKREKNLASVHLDQLGTETEGGATDRMTTPTAQTYISGTSGQMNSPDGIATAQPAIKKEHCLDAFPSKDVAGGIAAAQPAIKKEHCLDTFPSKDVAGSVQGNQLGTETGGGATDQMTTPTFQTSISGTCDETEAAHPAIKQEYCFDVFPSEGSTQFNQLATATRGCATDQMSTPPLQSSISGTSDQMNSPDETMTAHPAQVKEHCLDSVPSKSNAGSIQFNQLGTATRGCATDQTSTSTFQSSISGTSDQMNSPDETTTAHPAQEKEHCLNDIPSKGNAVRRASQGVKRYKEGKHSDDSSSDAVDSDFEYSPVYSQKHKVVDDYSPEASVSESGSYDSNSFVGDSDSNEDQGINQKGTGKAQKSKKNKEHPYPKETEQEDEAELVKRPFEDHCPMCDKVIPNRKKLLVHARTHTELKCKLCGSVFAQRYSIYEHFRMVHQQKKRSKKTVKKQHLCNICNKTFSWNNTLILHIESVHKKMKRYMCEICGHATYEKATLTNHIRSFHNREKNFKCTICEQAFFFITGLKNHLKIHTGEKSHQCTLCSKKFTRLGGFKEHLRTHTGERRHKCQICGKQYENLNNLKLHQDKTHRKIKPFNCEICGKCFRTKCRMELHLRVHTGEKPYECAICKKTFARSSNYGMHMRMHNDVRPYVCTVCNKRFYNASNLKTHVRSHNKKLNV